MPSDQIQRIKNLEGPILVTGHTGFKGAWTTIFLQEFGLEVIGLSLPAKQNSLYSRLSLKGSMKEEFFSIEDYDRVKSFLIEHKPISIIHLAAQPLVLESYLHPRETFSVNIMGTVNLLDAAIHSDSVKSFLAITTDKVYQNINTEDFFSENSPLRGSDPYSASKVGTEAAVAAWQKIVRLKNGYNLSSARSGNVIGGGDESENRLIPDLINGFSNNNQVLIRNPLHTRPWQHVLDPVFGYLLLLSKLQDGETIDSANFGPGVSSLSAGEVAEIAAQTWGAGAQISLNNEENISLMESETLNLDIELARNKLDWNPRWSQQEAIIKSVEWWKKVLVDKDSALEAMKTDIAEFLAR